MNTATTKTKLAVIVTLIAAVALAAVASEDRRFLALSSPRVQARSGNKGKNAAKASNRR